MQNSSVCRRLLNASAFVAAGLLVGGLFGCGSGPLRNLQRGCEQGSGNACFKLGVAYYEGKDEKGTAVDLDYARARKAFEQSCSRENGTACYNLGYMLTKGEGGPVDKTHAVDYYKKGCEFGDNTACTKGAVAYRDGAGVPKDMEKALALSKIGCDRNEKDACELQKALATTPDANGLTAEVKGLIEGCDAGNADSCFEAGVRFDDGKGVPQNKERAAVAYKVACEKGDLRGCHNLGVMQIDGEGIPRNVGTGFRNLDQACTKGLKKSCEVLVGKLNRACTQANDADACTVMGRFLIKGEKGMESNITKGVDFLRRGCRLGDKDGCEDLRKLGLDPN
ncbi:MAG: sel1 repeat family protein [Myxococcales bacterium]|nr:sel1 repeat family protein [Myxococcales bacterium]